MNFSARTKLLLVKAAQASAGTAINSNSVDMRGFENVQFFVSIATAGSANFVKVQSSDDDSTFNDLTGTKVVVPTDGDIVGVDVIRPRERYVRLVIDRSGGNTATGDAYAVQYAPQTMPTTQPTTVVLERHVSPAEGTA